MQAQPDSIPIFDASDLVYIAGAWLRFLMKARKTIGQEMKIRNVSPEVYEILETTGFTELFRVKKRMREISVDGFTPIFYDGMRKSSPSHMQGCTMRNSHFPRTAKGI